MSDFIEALQQIAKEKDIPLDTLIETVESALATAYKRNNPTNGEIKVRIDSNRSAQNPFKVYSERVVVESVENPHEQIALEDAQARNPDIMVGETFTEDVPQGSFGRIAAQTAKQVVVQRIREAERRKIFDEFNERVGEVVTGTVQRREGRTVIIGLGKLDAVLPTQEQVETEPYRFNDRIKVYVLEVKDTPKGPQVIVSRTHPSLIRRLFELEVPEIADGIVTIKSVAREPGARSKIAVMSRDEKVDPVGACVGHRGSRVQAVVNELYDEKIDIVRWNADTAGFIGEALSPAKAVKVTINEESKSAFVVVPDNQLSLAIGKAGQNVRLAARLTGWRIDIRSEAQVARAQLMAMTDQLTGLDDETEPGPVTIGGERADLEEDDIVIGAGQSPSSNGQFASGAGEETDLSEVESASASVQDEDGAGGTSEEAASPYADVDHVVGEESSAAEHGIPAIGAPFVGE